MVTYQVVFSKNAQKNIPKLRSANLTEKVRTLIEIIKEDPFRNPPPYEKLIGDMSGLYSRRINIRHRLVYKVDETKKVIQIVSVWSHYEF